MILYYNTSMIHFPSRNFKNGGMFLERMCQTTRHVACGWHVIGRRSVGGRWHACDELRGAYIDDVGSVHSGEQ